MKMNYQRTKPASKRTTKVIIGIAVFLILVRLILPHAFAAFFADIFSPLWQVKNFVIRSSVPSGQIVFSSDSPFASSTIADLAAENTELKNLLGRPASQNSVLADVLSKPPFSLYDTLIVDAGSEEGIQTGDQVYALASAVVVVASSTASATTTSASVPAASSTATSTSATSVSNPQIEIPIGLVAEVYGGTSVVSLFSSPGQKYTVSIGPAHVSASALAAGAGMFEAMVPNDSNVHVGDAVVVPSIQPSVFASVVSIVSDPARPYSLVLFQSPVDPFSLYFVEIQKPHDAKAK
jgi:hypothetical protein